MYIRIAYLTARMQFIMCFFPFIDACTCMYEFRSGCSFISVDYLLLMHAYKMTSLSDITFNITVCIFNGSGKCSQQLENALCIKRDWSEPFVIFH